MIEPYTYFILTTNGHKNVFYFIRSVGVSTFLNLGTIGDVVDSPCRGIEIFSIIIDGFFVLEL